MISTILERYCTVLEVSSKASVSEVRDAYKRMALRYHPDKNQTADTAERFKAAKEAYDYVIAYVEKRQPKKDKKLQKNEANAKKANVNKKKPTSPMSEEEPEKADTPASPPEPSMQPSSQPAPNSYIVELTLEEIFTGCDKTIEISRKKYFEDATRAPEEIQTHVKLNIKPGTLPGTVFTLSQHGDIRPGLTPADVIITIADAPHPTLKRAPNNIDLQYEHTIAFEDLLTLPQLSFSIRGLNQETVYARIPDFITPRYEHRILGAGLPIRNINAKCPHKKRGDMVVHFQIIYPAKLTEENRIALAKAWLMNANTIN